MVPAVAAAGAAWGAAEKVPGSAALNKGGSANTHSVSCASAGNCSAGGYYTDSSGAVQAMVAGEKKGIWGKAAEVPGSAALNTGGNAAVYSVSCGSAANCSAGGFYTDGSGHPQAFVVGETGSTWGTAEQVPGTAALNTGGDAAVYSVSCGSAGNCSAGGHYRDGSDHFQAFVVGETDGTWGTAVEVPGTAALNTGGVAQVSSVSCASAGNCSAGGFYTDGAGHPQAFVVSETGGTWGTAQEVPGTAALNAGGNAGVSSVSCASAGDCSAGGYYTAGAGHQQAFVVGETNGTWGIVEQVLGTPPLSGGAQLESVSCGSAGNCSGGGYYTDLSGHRQAFTIEETGGIWGIAAEVPGTAALNAGGNAQASSVSCASAGNCSAVGSYADDTGNPGHIQVFVVVEVNGAWGTAEQVPGIAALNVGGEATILSVSCASATSCSAGGSYASGIHHGTEQYQAFVVSTPGTWGSAEEIPGAAALNADGGAEVFSVSCASAGDCSAGGDYADGSAGQVFVVGETGGTWGTAEQVPGTAALNTGGDAEFHSVSCASAGNCSAGGTYAEEAGDPHHFQAFVVSETGGAWGTAEEVPGTAALNAGYEAGIVSVSCASAGNCSAGGYYLDGSGLLQAFVVSETAGTWGTAEQVPGTAALNQGGNARVYSVSCGSAGNCSAGGQYRDASGNYQAFVVGEADGAWGTAEEVPGTAALNADGGAEVYSVSCTSAGNCSAGGTYVDGSPHEQAFVVSETGGTWGTAEEVPGTAALNTAAPGAQLLSLSCASAGNCSAGGFYTDSSGNGQAFVVSETGGTWGTAAEVPGTAALNTGGYAQVLSVSCGSAGNCSAGGQYTDSSGHTQAFVASESNGTWLTAEEVPGTAALNQGLGAQVSSVSCTSAVNCSAGGYYQTSSGTAQAFVVSETGGS